MLRRTLAMVGAIAIACAIAIGALWLRPNRAAVDPRLEVDHWAAVTDGEHNSNTDMILWRDDFLLVHDARPWHLGSPDARLVVKRSPDGRRWETLARLQMAGQDIRDPKLVVIGDRLHLYALPNDGTWATPEGTVLSTSSDGVSWTPFEPVGPPGWLFWRPKTNDGGHTWYVPAYWHGHGRSILLRSTDGVSWEQVSTIHEGEGNDETAIEFLPDGRMIATCRLEVTPDTILGNRDASTLIAVAEPPYDSWSAVHSDVTRLDGPVLFTLDGTVFAVARQQPGSRGFPTYLGGVLSRKRTAIYRVEPERLVWLSDLPSAGDTSYAGVVRRGDDLYVDYYTSRVDRDFPWVLGMFLPTEIRMARIPTDSLLELSAATP